MLSGGNEEQAQAANKAFEHCYAQPVAGGHCSPIPGAEDVITSLRGRGITTALTTGFAKDTQTAIINALGWSNLAVSCCARSRESAAGRTPICRWWP